MRARWSRDGWLGFVAALLGFAVFTACVPSCNMPIGPRDKPLRREVEERERLQRAPQNLRGVVDEITPPQPPVAPPPTGTGPQP